MNITKAPNAQKSDTAAVALKLVAVDVAGSEVPREKMILEEIVVALE